MIQKELANLRNRTIEMKTRIAKAAGGAVTP